MPSSIALSAGASIAVSLAAGGTLHASGTGTMQVAPPFASALINLGSGESSVGPFATAVTVNLVAGAGGIGYHTLTPGASDADLFNPTQVAGLQAMVSGAGKYIPRRPRPASQGVPLWDCSTLTGYSVTGTAVMSLVDSVSASQQLGKATTKSIQLVVPAGTNSELNFPVLAAALQVPNGSFMAVIELISGDSGAQAQFSWFLADTGAYTNYFLMPNQLNWYGQNIIAPTSMPIGAGTPTASNIKAGKLRITAGTSAVTVVVHGIYAAQAMPPSVSIIHDDGDITAFTELLPRLNQYGWKCGYGIIRDLIGNGGFINAAQLDQLYASGHDLLTHGQYALSSFGSVALALADIAYNRDWLAARGYTRGQEAYVYPNGVQEYSTTDRLSLRVYLASIGVKAGWLASGVSFACAGTLGGLSLPRYAINATVNTTTLLSDLDAALAAGRSTTFMVHQILASGATGADTLRTTLDTVIAGLRTRELAGSLRIVSPMEQVAEIGLLS